MARTSTLGGGKGIILPGLPTLSFTAGDYIPPALAGILVESGATATGLAFAIPFVVDTPTNVTAIVYRNNDVSANGQKVRTGLYRFTAHGVATQLQTAAERTLTASAVTNEDTITSTQLVPGFRYAAVLTFDSSTVIARIDNDGTSPQPIFRSFNAPSNKLFSANMTPTDWTTIVYGTYAMTHVYGALPATFTATQMGASTTPYAALKVA
jgi:hypothetical protein